jgi:thymidine phosphorylase
MDVALLGLKMKAGRAMVGDIIDPAVGIELVKSPGDAIKKGEAWCIVHHNTVLDQDWDEMKANFIQVVTNKPDIPSRIIKVLHKDSA